MPWSSAGAFLHRLLTTIEDAPVASDPLAGANARYQHGERRRLAGGAVAGVVLLILIALFGPDRDEVRRHFEFIPGAAGPLRVMPELSIDQGRDPRHQEPEQFRNLWRPPPEQTFVPNETAGRPVAPPQPIPVPQPQPDAAIVADPDLSLADAVEMRLPQQTSRCFVLERMVRPEYPLGADAQARRLPVVTVEAAFYVNEMGIVAGSYVIQSTGGPLFDTVVLKAVNAWVFRPVADPTCPPLGFWIRLPVLFHSPYAPRAAP
jgi:TonB family protein